MLRHFLLILVLICLHGVAQAESYIFSSPPTQDKEASEKMYSPLVKFMSEVTGKEIIYEYSENWLNYTLNMQKAKYDFLFDAPHFVSWRVEKIEHQPLISLSHGLSYVLVVLESSSYQSLNQLKAKKVCSSGAPNIDAITLLDQYDSNWSQPVIKIVRGFDQMYEALVSNYCVATIMPTRAYIRIKNSQSIASRVIFQSHELPHFGLSASPRISPLMRNALQSEILSKNAEQAFAEIDRYFGLEQDQDREKIEADADLFKGYAYLLLDFWGF